MEICGMGVAHLFSASVGVGESEAIVLLAADGLFPGFEPDQQQRNLLRRISETPGPGRRPAGGLAPRGLVELCRLGFSIAQLGEPRVGVGLADAIREANDPSSNRQQCACRCLVPAVPPGLGLGGGYLEPVAFRLGRESVCHRIFSQWLVGECLSGAGVGVATVGDVGLVCDRRDDDVRRATLAERQCVGCVARPRRLDRCTRADRAPCVDACQSLACQRILMRQRLSASPPDTHARTARPQASAGSSG